MMKVVVVDGDLAYPPTSGKRLRTLNLLLPLAKRHRIVYIGRNNDDPKAGREAATYLQDHGIEPHVVEESVARKSGPSFYARLAVNVLSPLPYSVASHDRPLMRQAVREYAANNAVELWQFEWSPYVRTLGERPGARRLIIAHNVDSLIWQRYYETAGNTLQRWYIKQQWRKFDAYEKAVFPAADRVVAVSEDDARLLRRDYGVTHVDVVDNGIDRAFYESVRGEHDSKSILFLGSLDWRPNLDAIDLLLDRIFPEVRGCEPDAKLLIVGRSPSPALVQRARTMPGVELHANVADVRPYLAQSGLMAVPLRIGGGSRLKILESLAAGLPVVSTRVGAEGLELESGRDLVLVDSVEQFAGALVKHMRDPTAIRKMTEQSRCRVLERYDWNVLAGKLEEVWQKTVASGS
jgi:glycosyltransferase involved in cell wall biosynthesis